MNQGHNNFVGNSITVGSNWFHKVDKVKPRWVGSSAVTAFRIKEDSEPPETLSADILLFLFQTA